MRWSTVDATLLRRRTISALVIVTAALPFVSATKDCAEGRIVIAKSGDSATFWVNRKQVPFLSRPGVQLIALDPVTQEIIEEASYAVGRASRTAEHKLLADVNALPSNAGVLVALLHTKYEKLDKATLEALHKLGSPTLMKDVHKGLAFIGSIGGKPTTVGTGLGSEVKGTIPCLAKTTTEKPMVIHNSAIDAVRGPELEAEQQLADEIRKKLEAGSNNVSTEVRQRAAKTLKDVEAMIKDETTQVRASAIGSNLILKAEGNMNGVDAKLEALRKEKAALAQKEKLLLERARNATRTMQEQRAIINAERSATSEARSHAAIVKAQAAKMLAEVLEKSKETEEALVDARHQEHDLAVERKDLEQQVSDLQQSSNRYEKQLDEEQAILKQKLFEALKEVAEAKAAQPIEPGTNMTAFVEQIVSQQKEAFAREKEALLARVAATQKQVEKLLGERQQQSLLKAELNKSRVALSRAAATQKQVQALLAEKHQQDLLEAELNESRVALARANEEIRAASTLPENMTRTFNALLVDVQNAFAAEVKHLREQSANATPQLSAAPLASAAPLPSATPRQSAKQEREGGPGWVLWWLLLLAIVLLLCVVLLFCCMFLLYSQWDFKGSTTVRLTQAKNGKSRELSLDVFRLNATRDRYGYFEMVERAEGAFDARTVVPWTRHERFMGKRVVVVLEKCALELAADTSLASTRSENDLIATHECLISLLDSPLNKAGKLLIYLHSAEGMVVEVHPACRVPRMFGTFVQMVNQVLRTGRVQGHQASFPLMQVLSGTMEKHLPPKARRFALTQTGRPVSFRDFAVSTESTANIKTWGGGCVVFAIGASANDAPIERDFGASYCQDTISVCAWGLRARCICQMVCHEFESLWEVFLPISPERFAENVEMGRGP